MRWVYVLLQREQLPVDTKANNAQATRSGGLVQGGQSDEFGAWSGSS